MDHKQPKQENPSPLSTTKPPNQDSPRKPPPPVGGGGATSSSPAAVTAAGDRLKRDEWSEGAVSTLLEAYEAKWVLRNRAKLKGQDWEDVAKHVSARGNWTKSPKTQTQCKNKIESMKKRYRSESAAAADGSSWPLFPRLDLLLRGNAPLPHTPPPPPPQQQLPPPNIINSHLMVLEPSQPPPPQPPPAPPLLLPPPPPPHPLPLAQNSHGSNGVDRGPKEDGVGPKLSDHESDRNPAPIDTDSSTPALYSDDKDKMKSKSTKTRAEKRKRRRGEMWGEVGESIRLLAEVMVRSEQARMETMREVERMRAEAEAKRGEMDLKRTEIIANAQLEIARMFAAGVGGKGNIDSSLRIGRS